MKSSGVALIGCALLAVAAAIVIGSRLSDQAIAALAGAACGIGLTAPLGIALGMYAGSSRSQSRSAHAAPPPQVVVIPMPAPNAPNAPAYPTIPGPPMPVPRSFTIIGEGSPEDDGE